MSKNRPTDEAIKFYRQALARKPQLPKSLAGLEEAYIRKGETAQGIRYLKDAIAIEPGMASFHYQLGRAYLSAGRRAEAEKEFATVEKLQAEDHRVPEAPGPVTRCLAQAFSDYVGKFIGHHAVKQED